MGEVEPDGGTYEVEKVLDHRITKGASLEFYLKWVGYTDADNTWEIEGNVEGSPDALGVYWEIGKLRKGESTEKHKELCKLLEAYDNQRKRQKPNAAGYVLYKLFAVDVSSYRVSVFKQRLQELNETSPNNTLTIIDHTPSARAFNTMFQMFPDFQFVSDLVNQTSLSPTVSRTMKCSAKCACMPLIHNYEGEEQPRSDEMKTCECLQYFNTDAKCLYDDKGQLNIKDVTGMLIECASSCACAGRCAISRVGPSPKRAAALQIFHTNKSGWGLRTLRSLKQGDFVTRFAGELITEKEAEQRFDATYARGALDSGLLLVSLSVSPGKPAEFTIDMNKMANEARFINHSCSPNLCLQSVLSDLGADAPTIALFAAKNIEAGSELTYDYGIQMEVPDAAASSSSKKKKSNHIKCNCRTSNCRGVLMYID